MDRLLNLNSMIKPMCFCIVMIVLVVCLLIDIIVIHWQLYSLQLNFVKIADAMHSINYNFSSANETTVKKLQVEVIFALLEILDNLHVVNHDGF